MGIEVEREEKSHFNQKIEKHFLKTNDEIKEEDAEKNKEDLDGSND